MLRNNCLFRPLLIVLTLIMSSSCHRVNRNYDSCLSLDGGSVSNNWKGWHVSKSPERGYYIINYVGIPGDTTYMIAFEMNKRIFVRIRDNDLFPVIDLDTVQNSLLWKKHFYDCDENVFKYNISWLFDNGILYLNSLNPDSLIIKSIDNNRAIH